MEMSDDSIRQVALGVGETLVPLLRQFSHIVLPATTAYRHTHSDMSTENKAGH